MNLKRIAALICASVLALACTACKSEPAAGADVIPLTEEEVEILGMMGEDVHVIPESGYVENVTEFQDHVGVFSGQVYQLEGIYTTTKVNGVDTAFLYRVLVHDGERTQCGMPIRYLDKELPEGSWIRLTAIIGSDEYGGERVSTFDKVAVETLAQAGNTELEWDGVGHKH